MRPDKGSASWMILLVVAFLTMASLSALIAWALARAEDTAQHRALSVPQAQIDITAASILAKLTPAPAAEEHPAETPAPETAAAATPAPVSDMAVPVTPVEIKPLSDPKLLEKTEQGALPVIADGKAPWKTYAARFDKSGDRPKIALIVSGLGLRQSVSAMAIETLPPLTALAFSPYGGDLRNYMQAARNRNQETLIELPMEPFYYPVNDAGPQSLLSAGTAEENLKRMQWAMAQGEGYVGLIGFMGGKFLTVDGALRPVLTELKKRGLIFVDNGAAINSLSGKIAEDTKTPLATVTLVLDDEPSKAAIEAKLAQLETQAKSSGIAIGLGHGLPVTINAIAAFAQGLEQRGVMLVPVTALVR